MEAKPKCAYCGNECINQVHDAEKVFCSLECCQKEANDKENEIKSLPGLCDYVVGLNRPDEDIYYFKLFLGDKRTKKIRLPLVYKVIDKIEAKNLNEAMKILKSKLADFKSIKKISNEEFEAKGKTKQRK